MSPVHILVAEDNQGDVFLVEEALKSNNLNCVMQVARNGQCAMEMLEKAEAGKMALDLLLLDLNLPKISGDQLLTYIRQSQQMKTLPVIVVTSSDSPKDRAQVQALGADYYFRKPSSLEDFLRLGLIVQQVWEASNAGLTRRTGRELS